MNGIRFCYQRTLTEVDCLKLPGDNGRHISIFSPKFHRIEGGENC